VSFDIQARLAAKSRPPAVPSFRALRGFGQFLPDARAFSGVIAKSIAQKIKMTMA
jgi:hypothetical protein